MQSHAIGSAGLCRVASTGTAYVRLGHIGVHQASHQIEIEDAVACKRFEKDGVQRRHCRQGRGKPSLACVCQMKCPGSAVSRLSLASHQAGLFQCRNDLAGGDAIKPRLIGKLRLTDDCLLTRTWVGYWCGRVRLSLGKPAQAGQDEKLGMSKM